MSWLLVALIPGLLMMATFGLERVESGLSRDALSPSDVDDFLEHARTGAESPTPASFVTTVSTQGLPTHEYLRQLSNTEFRQTRHADRV